MNAGQMALHERFMSVALAMGRRGLGRAWPNPSVGCIIVKDGKIVARAYTADGGRPHAEPQALEQAGTSAQGATLYVSLEPCSHFGQTPPCAQAIINAGIACVVVAVIDSDPRVCGQGIKMLRKAGIQVITDVLAEQARADLAGFFMRVGQNRPFVTLKLANSIDGRIATASGDSQWITGPTARRVVHSQRSRHDAILVGAGTVRHDNPSLTVRDMGNMHNPVRILISRKINVPDNCILLQTAKSTPTWILHGPNVEQSRLELCAKLGVELIEAPLNNGQIALKSVMNILAERGITSLYCEGGGQLAANLCHDKLVDELINFSAGVIIGAEGQPSFAALGQSVLSKAPRWELIEQRAIGGDIMARWRPKN